MELDSNICYWPVLGESGAGWKAVGCWFVCVGTVFHYTTDYPFHYKLQTGPASKVLLAE